MEINQKIDVSVYMLTYFHEKYVSEAIESVLGQKTKYTFELVISDDCSKDSTVEILKKYEKEYPDKIRLQLNEENIGIPRNIFQARCMCRGRYIVALSGDDYWIDDRKLEKEVRFLDEHPEFFSLYNVVEMRNDGSKEAYEITPPKDYWDREYTLCDYERGCILDSHGFMMRNVFLTEEGRYYFKKSQEISKFVDDAVDAVFILKKGPAYILGVATDAHRVIKDTANSNNYNSKYTRLERLTHHIELYNALHKEFGNEIDFSYWYSQWFIVGIFGMIRTWDLGGYRKILRTIPKRYKRGFKNNIYLRLLPDAASILIKRIKRLGTNIGGGK